MSGAAHLADPMRQASCLSGWNEIVGAAFAGCAVDAADPLFAGRLGACAIGELRFVKIAAGASRVRRWGRGRPARPAHAALLHLQTAGAGLNRQAGVEAAIAPVAAVLCDADRPYEIDFLTSYQMFVVEIPEPAILRHAPGFDLERAAGRALDPSRAQLLLGFLGAAWDQLDLLGGDADWRDCVSRISTELALRAIVPHGESAGPGVELRHAVLAYIRQNLADPGLRTGGIAKALGVSPRAVQTVFEAMATTASAYILQGRLARAAGLMRAARGAAPITQIAYDCGFSDSAYFSRCFRKAYGVPPRRFLAG